MIPLNPPLFNKLIEKFGSALINKKGSVGQFSRPYGSKGSVYQVDNEEIYTVRCPVCEDTDKHRLAISYLCGQTVKIPGRKTPVEFSKKFRCFHNECQRDKELWKRLRDSGIWDLDVLDMSNISSMPVKVSTTGFFNNKPSVNIPSKALPLNSPKVPAHVLNYILSRRFDPEEIHKDAKLMWIPAGTKWEVPNSVLQSNPDCKPEWNFYYDKILIPIVGRRKLAGWQVRKITDEDRSPKYLTSPAADLAGILYNMDNAKLCRGVILTEGVFDTCRASQVWEDIDSEGNKIKLVDSCGLLGKGLNEKRLKLISHLWGSSMDWGCIMLDGINKDPSTVKTANEIVAKLRKYKAFPRGLSIAHITEGDPDDYTPEQLWEFVKNSKQAW